MSTATVLPDRLERFMQPDFKLRLGSGKGVNGYADVCIMQAVAWLANEQGRGDAPDCACTTIRSFCIRLNDSWLFDDQHRHMLKPFAPRIVGTKSSAEITRRRALLACDYAVRVFAPIRLRSLRREEWAEALESLSEITGKNSADLAKISAKRIRNAAATAADSAAYAIAIAIVDVAAYAAAAAYATAAAAAAAAAHTAAAAYAGAPADQLRARSLECLDQMISLA